MSTNKRNTNRTGFLYNHPNVEREFSSCGKEAKDFMDSHVIVDREEWRIIGETLGELYQKINFNRKTKIYDLVNDNSKKKNK